ncbi:CvpA family protein [Microvirga lotononidis]|uniref:Putative membrane protein, required for colicin V production n=1 Tax=Microvirga lotononidis TaxID=864069 RepID=I4Z058_9HYPH|nr:CvpA family protein [Microvirga lotononidis]EIM29600.1 putative membrane protein, required for colicin V production [Microvirga lotononidis]WQO27093.1 CvpA family protein [Microvirga lotononidis]
MPVSVLDLVVIGIVLISALLAAVRGFTREVLAIVAWVVAAAAAWYLHPTALPIAHQYISSNTVALVAAIGGIFVVTLIIVSIITVQVSDLILDSRIGALDRTLGLFFGAARGFLICVIGWAFLGWLLQGKEPEWAASSRTRPAMENTRDNIIAMLPENAEALLQRLRNKEAPAETEPAEPDPQRPAAPAAPAPQPPQRRS